MQSLQEILVPPKALTNMPEVFFDIKRNKKTTQKTRLKKKKYEKKSSLFQNLR